MLTLVALWRLKKPSPELNDIHALNVALYPSSSPQKSVGRAGAVGPKRD